MSKKSDKRQIIVVFVTLLITIIFGGCKKSQGDCNVVTNSVDNSLGHNIYTCSNNGNEIYIDGKEIYRVINDNRSELMITAQGNINFIGVNGNYIYYATQDNKLYSIEITSKEEKCIDDNITILDIESYSDYVYVVFVNPELDMTSIKKIGNNNTVEIVNGAEEEKLIQRGLYDNGLWPVFWVDEDRFIIYGIEYQQNEMDKNRINYENIGNSYPPVTSVRFMIQEAEWVYILYNFCENPNEPSNYDAKLHLGNEIVKLNLTTGETTTVYKNTDRSIQVGTYSVYDNKIYTINGKNVLCSKLDGSEEKLVGTLDGYNSVDSGENNTIAIDTFITIFENIKKCIRQYTWTLDNLVDSLNNASNVLYETDQQVASEIEEQ